MYKIEKRSGDCIVARIVADSKSAVGKRITTFELEYPRFIHAQVMTHRVFSRNAMSSRAVPVEKLIEQVENNPVIPSYWGSNKPGMSAGEELTGADLASAKMGWECALKNAVNSARGLAMSGAHKQIANRLLEPFATIKVVLTATEWDNFFKLRLDEHAQPEIYELAKCMKECMDESTPFESEGGSLIWHLPYIVSVERDGKMKYFTGDHEEVTVDEALAISASCCAQVSYRNIDNSYEKAMKVYERLGVGTPQFHASPFEHQAVATLVANSSSANFRGWIQYREYVESKNGEESKSS